MKTWKDVIKDIENKSEADRISINALIKEIDFVDKLKRKRNKMGMSQKELADKVGMTVYEIERFEWQMKSPTLETVIKIAEALNMDMEIIIL